MIHLSPKQQFLANKDEVTAFANIANMALVQRAFTVALAEMALTGATADELRGARSLASKFLNLTEPEPIAEKAYPPKPLKNP